MALSLCALSAAMVVLSLVSGRQRVLRLVVARGLRSLAAAVGRTAFDDPRRGRAAGGGTGRTRKRGLRDRVSFIGYQCAVAAGMAVVLLMVVFQNEPGMIERMPGLLTTLMLTSSALPSIILGFSDTGVEDAEAGADE
ncbi:hypothetical protein LV779_02165 [Streptomyces thinghirensis]|nr:hypothetical protein [Streptomyces thinghirensis]